MHLRMQYNKCTYKRKENLSICPQPPLRFVLVSLICCHWSTAVTIYIKLQYNSLKHLQFLYWSKCTCWEEKPRVSGHTLISRWTWAVQTMSSGVLGWCKRRCGSENDYMFILVNLTALFWHQLFMKHSLIHTKLKVVAKLPELRSPQ